MSSVTVGMESRSFSSNGERLSTEAWSIAPSQMQSRTGSQGSSYSNSPYESGAMGILTPAILKKLDEEGAGVILSNKIDLSKVYSEEYLTKLSRSSSQLSDVPLTPSKDCSICKSDFKDESIPIVELACKHIFHHHCLTQEFRREANKIFTQEFNRIKDLIPLLVEDIKLAECDQKIEVLREKLINKLVYDIALIDLKTRNIEVKIEESRGAVVGLLIKKVERKYLRKKELDERITVAEKLQTIEEIREALIRLIRENIAGIDHKKGQLNVKIVHGEEFEREEDGKIRKLSPEEQEKKLKNCPFPHCGVEVRHWDIKEIHQSRIKKTRCYAGKNCIVIPLLVIGIMVIVYFAYYKKHYGSLT